MSGSDPVSVNLPFVVRFSAVLRGYWGQTFLAIDLRGKSLRRTKVGLRLLFECNHGDAHVKQKNGEVEHS